MPGQRPSGPPDVEQRHGHHRHGVVPDPEDLDRAGQDGGDVAPGDHDALGKPGRPRGVELGDDVLGAGLEPGIGGRSGAHRAEPLVEARQGHAASDGGEPRSHLLDGAGIVVSVEEDDGAGVVDDGGHLGRGQSPVDGHRDGTEQCAAEEHLEVLDAIAVEEGDPVAGADAVGGQGAGHLDGPVVELAPGE